ncbi:MAG: hypothetical protein M1398_01320 [Deltaproteobacteria bacterium]|nr:hypothetical protein [Deltaproteobacteria bacterium]MDA8306064.1 hypothetical protein [Deltaproteobacteria bacterium]
MIREPVQEWACPVNPCRKGGKYLEVKLTVYLLHLYFENARENRNGEVCFKKGDNRLSKWTFFDSNQSNRELLRLIAVACGGTRLLPRIQFPLQRLCLAPETPLRVECILALHPPYETAPPGTLLGCGIQVVPGAGPWLAGGEGAVRHLISNECHHLYSKLPIRKAKTGLGDSYLFLLGYGPKLKSHDGTDDFDFSDPFFRRTRFYSLFHDHALLTDPVEFLTRLHYRAVKYKRLAATHVLERLSRLFKKYFDINTECWMEGECDFASQWRDMAAWQKRAVLPAIDASRHLLDAYQKSSEPLETAGLILFDRPDLICPGELFPVWATVMDRLLPNMQFLITADDRSSHLFPGQLRAESHDIPTLPERSTKPPARVPKGAILLVDVDSSLPNLALMKLSRYFKEQGRNVILAKHKTFMTGVDGVYASCVFSRAVSQDRLNKLRNYYGDSLVVGGSGVDPATRLPEEIESLPADYDLYPELEDRAIGFITRGCPFRCPFCIVPTKEGMPHQVSNLDELLAGRRKLILLDDNILAHPNAVDFLEEMAVRDIGVNFNQTLDLRMVDRNKARLLKRVHCSNVRFTRSACHFSLNDNRNLEEVRSKYELFGFTGKNNVEFICMYGFNTTLAEDVDRFRFLRSLPGAYVFVQEYLPFPGGPSPNITNFFDERADRLIEELIHILFPQNMKSMEKYYRWVSKFYAQIFGKLHRGLVDTIFRYNSRQNRGHYLATMAHLLQ